MKTLTFAAVLLVLVGVGDFPTIFGQDAESSTEGIYAQIRGTGGGRIRASGGRGGGVGGGLLATTIEATIGATVHATSMATSASTSERHGGRRYGYHPRLKPFISANLAQIAEEIAEGKGEYLGTVAGLLGCRGTLHAAFGRWSQANIELLLPSTETGPEGFLDNVSRATRSHPVFGKQCRAGS